MKQRHKSSRRIIHDSQSKILSFWIALKVTNVKFYLTFPDPYERMTARMKTL